MRSFRRSIISSSIKRAIAVVTPPAAGSVGTSARYWRVLVSSMQGGLAYTQIGEIKFYSGGVLRALYSIRNGATWPLVIGMYNDQFFVYNGAFKIQTGTPALNALQHLAVVRDGNMLYFYVNGVMIGLAASTSAYGSATATATIGGDPNFGQWTSGYLDDVRITKGVARYKGGTMFTPPAAAF
jgi:hypothetical protein